jgi:hypothetical protein
MLIWQNDETFKGLFGRFVILPDEDSEEERGEPQRFKFPCEALASPPHSAHLSTNFEQPRRCVASEPSQSVMMFIVVITVRFIAQCELCWFSCCLSRVTCVYSTKPCAWGFGDFLLEIFQRRASEYTLIKIHISKLGSHFSLTRKFTLNDLWNQLTAAAERADRQR